MSIGIRKKIVGLIAGGSLTLLGVFLPVGGASAATLKFLLNKDFWIGVGGELFYDQLLNPILGELPAGFTENTDLTTSAFESIGIKTFIAAGGGVFYTGKDGKIADNQLAALVYANNQQASREVSRSFKIEGKSPEKAPYLIKVDVLAKTINNLLFPDETQVNVGGIVQETGTEQLTGEQMYAGGFSVAYINGKFETIAVNFSKQAMKTEPEPVPEPLTIFGTATALGCGVLFKQKSSKKTLS